MDYSPAVGKPSPPLHRSPGRGPADPAGLPIWTQRGDLGVGAMDANSARASSGGAGPAVTGGWQVVGWRPLLLETKKKQVRKV